MTSTIAAELISFMDVLDSCDYCICVMLICSAEIDTIYSLSYTVGGYFLCKLCEISIKFYSVCLLDQQEGCKS